MTGARDVVEPGVVLLGMPERDVPRVDGDVTGPLARSALQTVRPVVEHDLRQAVALPDRLTRDQRRAGEGGDERVVGRRDELVRRSRLQDPPLVDHADAVRERRGVLEVVGHDDGRKPEPVEQLTQLGANTAARVRVERGQRLVEQEHRRVARERAGERDTLALATGELLDARPREVADAEPVEQLLDPRRAVGAEADVAEHVRCGNSAYSWNR